jgi:two-component system, OmpR family, sensor kinase
MARVLWARITSHLYVRIWLAVVAAIVVLAFGVGAAWQLTRSPPQLPIREILIENERGELIGNAQTRPGRLRGEELEFDVMTKDGQKFNISLPRPQRPPGAAAPWIRPPFGFGWMLVVVGLAVALGAYPIIRRLTVRLESLQRGVERWGSGDLSTRIKVDGRDEVAFLARRFNHAAERIETLMDSHKSLLANASHELRSPLARIRMSLELLEPPTLSEGAAGRGSGSASAGPHGTQRNAVSASSLAAKEEIKRSIGELDQLIDEILLASRLDARQADAEPFELVDLTGLAAEECARVGAELEADLSGSGNHSLTVNGSPRLLRRLIRNLLENARRYGRGEIELVLSQNKGAADGRPRAVVTVNDRGPGVPPDQRERIFEPFYRLPGASEREGGVGLGLALVRSIGLRHGGSVRCEARVGGGAAFVVELPMLPVSDSA